MPVLAPLLTCLSGIAQPSWAQLPAGLRPEAALYEGLASAKSAQYQIRAHYDELKQQIRGQMRLRWTNRQARPESRIALRLYLNAFSHSDRSWLRQAGPGHRGNAIDPQALGYMHIRSIRYEQSPQAPNQWRDTPEEREDPLPWTVGERATLQWLDLPRTVGPGQSIDIELSFISQLPRVFARSGYAPDFVMAAQCFPKVAVHSAQGWKTPPFDYHSEFYSDFADYELWLNLPEGWAVVGTGEAADSPTEEQAQPGRYWHYRRATMVHDFAWSAIKDGQRSSAQVQDIEIEGLLAPGHSPADKNHIALQSELLSAMQKRYGPYPWRYISFVVPPNSAPGAQGMEYPTFYASDPYTYTQLPPWLYLNREDGAWTTIHEFGHQYFQGLVANDEATAPWLDEGVNTLTNVLIFQDIFGKNAGLRSWAGYPMTAEDSLRSVLYAEEFEVSIDRSASDFSAYPQNYGSTVYARAGLVLLTLRNLCGTGLFDRLLRDYVARFAFRHPTSQDFRSFFAEGLQGRCRNGDSSNHLDISAYFEATLDQPFSLDFRGELFGPSRHFPKGGWISDPEGRQAEPLLEKADPGETVYRQTLVLYREGSPALPLGYELVFADGRRQHQQWPAATQRVLTRHFDFQDPSNRIVRVQLDPYQLLSIERFRLNNSISSAFDEFSQAEHRLDQAPISMIAALQILVGSLLP